MPAARKFARDARVLPAHALGVAALRTNLELVPSSRSSPVSGSRTWQSANVGQASCTRSGSTQPHRAPQSRRLESTRSLFWSGMSTKVRQQQHHRLALRSTLGTSVRTRPVGAGRRNCGRIVDDAVIDATRCGLSSAAPADVIGEREQRHAIVVLDGGERGTTRRARRRGLEFAGAASEPKAESRTHPPVKHSVSRALFGVLLDEHRRGCARLTFQSRPHVVARLALAHVGKGSCSLAVNGYRGVVARKQRADAAARADLDPSNFSLTLRATACVLVTEYPQLSNTRCSDLLEVTSSASAS